MNKLAVVTVHDGHIKELNKTIDSVNNQALKPELHLIVSKKKITTKKKFNFRKFVIGKDKSIYNAMNIAFDLTRNYYVLFLNSGDYFYSNNSTKLIKNNINKNKKNCLNFVTLLKWERNYYKIKKKIFLQHNFFSHPSFIVPNEKRIKKYDENYKILSDGFWMKNNSKIFNFKKIYKTLTVHNLGGISSTPSKISVKDNFKSSIFEGIKEFIKLLLCLWFNNPKKYYEFIYKNKYSKI